MPSAGHRDRPLTPGAQPWAALLEGGLVLLVAGTALAMAGAEPWAAQPIWFGSAGLALLLVVRPRAAPRSAPVSIRSLPLALPGALFVAWIALQLVPWPSPVGRGETISVAPAATFRGALFVFSCLLVHVVAGFALRERVRFERFVWTVAYLGLALALVAAFQQLDAKGRAYGVLTHQPGSIPFGPFWNRNQFASYMLMTLFASLSCLAGGWQALQRLGPTERGWRGRLWQLEDVRGSPVLFALAPALASLAALLMTTSRGAILSLVACLLLVALQRRSAARLMAPAIVSLVLLAALLDARIAARFERVREEGQVRTRIWSRTLDAAADHWLTGTGLNTFARVVPRWTGYPAAHNEYLQLLLETGVPGLALAAWGLLAALRAWGTDPWLRCALVGPLLHAGVDFVFQAPALGLLFAALSGALAVQPRA